MRGAWRTRFLAATPGNKPSEHTIPKRLFDPPGSFPAPLGQVHRACSCPRKNLHRQKSQNRSKKKTSSPPAPWHRSWRPLPRVLIQHVQAVLPDTAGAVEFWLYCERRPSSAGRRGCILQRNKHYARGSRSRFRRPRRRLRKAHTTAHTCRRDTRTTASRRSGHGPRAHFIYSWGQAYENFWQKPKGATASRVSCGGLEWRRLKRSTERPPTSPAQSDRAAEAGLSRKS